MKKWIVAATAAVFALVTGFPEAVLQAKEKPVAAPTGPAVFTDSNAAQLAVTKRVAIANVLIQFQASTNAVAGGRGAATETLLEWPEFDQKLQTEFASFAYEKLKADLTTAGFEVVSEAELKASPSYATLIREGGIPHHTRYTNLLGDAFFVGPSSLQPYLPSHMEAGMFLGGPGFLGWVSKGSGQSITPGGPNRSNFGDNWKLPGIETALAKELNAHIVKATYVVALGRAEAQRARSLTVNSGSMIAGSSSSTVITATANAFAEPSLYPDQTRISFRMPNGTGKWQRVSLMKPGPAKDGDVSVRMAVPLFASTDYFKLTGDGGSSRQGFFDKALRIKFVYTAQLTDPKGYFEEVSAMIAKANSHMLALFKP